MVFLLNFALVNKTFFAELDIHYQCVFEKVLLNFLAGLINEDDATLFALFIE